MRDIKFRVWNNNEVVFHHLEFTDTGILSEDPEESKESMNRLVEIAREHIFKI